MATAILVTLAELKTFLGVTASTDDALLQSILDVVEQQFLAECNRRERPFVASAANNRAEVRDGNGSHVLTLDYAISDVDSIKLGFDSSDPDEELDPDDVEEVVWVAGKRTITRTDGGSWGWVDAPRYIHVQYDTQADAPDVPKTALKRMCGLIYRQLGSEGSSRESLANYTRDLARDDSIWMAAVAAEWEPRV